MILIWNTDIKGKESTGVQIGINPTGGNGEGTYKSIWLIFLHVPAYSTLNFPPEPAEPKPKEYITGKLINDQ